VGNDGIVELGQTREMLAVAEIYESDVDKVRLGQTAKITSDALTGELRGTVEHIGLQVQRQNIVNTDPSANIDGRIVEVKVRLVDIHPVLKERGFPIITNWVSASGHQPSEIYSLRVL
jgi:HlyD family secretion protein